MLEFLAIDALTLRGASLMEAGTFKTAIGNGACSLCEAGVTGVLWLWLRSIHQTRARASMRQGARQHFLQT